jgi:hypothetical protein
LVSYAIHNNEFEFSNIPNENDIMKIKDKIAFINVKKSGGDSVSYYKTINDYYIRDKNLLLNQMNLRL